MLFRCVFIKLNLRTSYAKPFSTSQREFCANEAVAKERSEELRSLFGCSPSTAQLIIRRNQKIVNINSEEFLNNIKFCKSNFRIKDVVEFPVVLSLPHEILNQRYKTLKEFGFNRIRPKYIANFLKIMQETPVKLQSVGLIQKQKNPLEDVLRQVAAPEEDKDKLRTKMAHILLRNHQLSTIKQKLTSEYLVWRLQQQKFTSSKLIKRHSLLLGTSLEEIETKICILTNDYGFTTKKVSSMPFLLCVHISHLKVFESIPDILGVPTKELVRLRPQLLHRSPNSLQKVASILLEYGITGAQLRTCPAVLMLNSSALKHRLMNLMSDTFSPLRSDRKFLRLVCHFKTLHKRIQLLEKASVPCSISLLTSSHSVFMNRLRVPIQNKVYTEEVIDHLSLLYNCSKERIRSVLRQYPKNYTSFTNVSEVIQFLTSRGVSKVQLWNGLGIIAYDIKVVKDFFNRLPEFPELQPFSEIVNHFNFIQLLIYVIDRYANNSTSLHPAELILSPCEVEASEVLISIEAEEDSSECGDVDSDEEVEDGSSLSVSELYLFPVYDDTIISDAYVI